MIQPDFREFQRLAKQGNLIPVYDVFPADLLTPVSAYLRIAQGARYSFLLESVEGGEKIARYTFAGANPEEVFRYAGGACVLESANRILWEERDPVTFLRARMDRFRPVRLPGLPPLVAGAIGYFSYDMVRLIERLPKRLRDDIGLYDAQLMFYHGIIAFDHLQHQLWIVRNVHTDGEGTLRSKYNAAVREIRKTRLLLEQTSPSEQPTKETSKRSGSTPCHFQFSPRRISRGGAQSEKLHSRRRYFSGGDKPAILGENTSRALPNLSRVARAQSFSLSFLLTDERCRRRRQLAGDARQSPGPRCFLSSHRGDALARQG